MKTLNIKCYAGLEVFTAVTMKNVFCGMALCGFIINRRFGRTCRLHLQGGRNNTSEEMCLMLVFVSASHRSLSSPPPRNLRNRTPVPATLSTIGSPAVRLLCDTVCSRVHYFKTLSHPSVLPADIPKPPPPPPKVIQCFQCSQPVSYHLTLFLAHVISSTLKMEVTRSSETSVYNKRTWRHIPEDDILHRKCYFNSVQLYTLHEVRIMSSCYCHFCIGSHSYSRVTRTN
jgi:hypothetical protein